MQELSESDNVQICEVCGDKIVDNGPGMSWIIHDWICGRCGKHVCFGCGGQRAGLGYGEEDSEKYGNMCLECYWELRESYAGKWESEFGNDDSSDNPYELSEDDREFRERIRSGAWRDD